MAGSLDLYAPTDNDLRKPLKPVSSYGRTAGGVWLPMLVGSNGAAAVTIADAPDCGLKGAATFTPAAAAYLANDIIEAAKAIALTDKDGAAFAGGEFIITSATLMVNHTAVISGETSYRLYLYSVTPPSAPADNAAWDLPSGDRASYLGYVDLGTPLDLGSTLWVETNIINKQVTVAATGTLYGLLVTNGPFTATAAGRVVVLHGLSV